MSILKQKVSHAECVTGMNKCSYHKGQWQTAFNISEGSNSPSLPTNPAL